MLDFALVLFLLIIWISDCLWLAHIVEIRMNSRSVKFQDRSLPSYRSRKLLKFWAYANSLDYLDCRNKKNLPPSMKAVVGTSSCATSLHHLDFRLFAFGSHSQNQDEVTVSLSTRQEYIFLFFEEVVWIWS